MGTLIRPLCWGFSAYVLPVMLGAERAVLWIAIFVFVSVLITEPSLWKRQYLKDRGEAPNWAVPATSATILAVALVLAVFLLVDNPMRMFNAESRSWLAMLWFVVFGAMALIGFLQGDEPSAASAGSKTVARALHNRTIPQDVKIEVSVRDEGSCRVCGSSRDLQYDHIVPYSLGGSSTDPDNIQLLCGGCNRSKGNRYIG